MPPTHRKLRRKELKEPDEFLSFLYDAREFVTGNLTQIAASAAVVVGVAMIAMGVYYYERHRDHLAAAQFYTAFSALGSKQYKTAQQDFTSLAASESGRELGRLARFYLAQCYLAENDLARARDSLVAYLADAHDQAFEGLAMMNLAIVYERLGDLKKAEGAYQQAASMPGAQASAAELAIARIRARAGDRAGAIDAYRSFLNAHPFSQDRQDAIEALAQLGAQPEAGGARSPAKVEIP